MTTVFSRGLQRPVCGVLFVAMFAFAVCIFSEFGVLANDIVFAPLAQLALFSDLRCGEHS
jgi:hypothetical protein